MKMMNRSLGQTLSHLLCLAGPFLHVQLDRRGGNMSFVEAAAKNTYKVDVCVRTAHCCKTRYAEVSAPQFLFKHIMEICLTAEFW